MIYEKYQRNHVILPGREEALHDFLNQELDGKRHKWNHCRNSNSEDALTWSCFEVLDSLPFAQKISALNEIFEDSYQGKNTFSFKDSELKNETLKIHVGKEYIGASTGESTEVDASIELPGKLVFFEAKLYSAISQETPLKRDQIARKLRVGVDAPLNDEREFFFIFLDIAPLDKLKSSKRGQSEASSSANFQDKWKSATKFDEYKYADGLKSMRTALEGLDAPPLQSIADNMGWLTWSDLFKSILRGSVV